MKYHIEGNKLRIEIAGLAYHIVPTKGECGIYCGHVIPEPTNAHDRKAIKICKDNGVHVGYIPKELTDKVRMYVGERKYPCLIEIKPVYYNKEFLTVEGSITLMDINVSEKTSASRPSPFKEENNNNALIWKWIILVGILLFVIFVVYPWATEQLDGSNKAKVTKNEVTQQETEIISKSNQVETAIDLAAENEMLIMDADNGLRFDMTSDQIEKHIIAQVRSGKMPNNNTITFMLKNGKVLHGHFKPYYTFGLLYSYELEFYMTPDGKDVTKNTYYDVVKTIDANHVGYMCYKSRSTVWIKDNMVIECGYRNLGSGTITLTYSNQPIAYNQRHGHDDYVKALCKTLLPQRDKHVHNMEKKYGGVVMEVLEYMRNRGSYEPVEWGPVVKKNNAYYVRHMYYSWNILHEKVLNNCMFRMDLDGEVTDIYAIDGTKYVYK